jgi:hypothetical protein
MIDKKMAKGMFLGGLQPQYNLSVAEYNGGSNTMTDHGSNSMSDQGSTHSDHFSAPPVREDAFAGEDSFARELSRLQEQQIVYAQKMVKEKLRKEQLEVITQKTKEQMKVVQIKTKSGGIVKDFEAVNQRQIGKMEHTLQMIKVKLSVAKNENSKLKKTVTEKRRDKMLQLQIQNDLMKETDEDRSKLTINKKEIALINDLKLKTKLAITNTKHQMVKDAEVFSTELEKAKKNIGSAQNDMLTNIRESLEATNLACESIKYSNANPPRAEESIAVLSDDLRGRKDARKREIDIILRETDFASIEELLVSVHQSEKDIFVMYNETQEKYEEVEKLDVENKKFEEQVVSQIRKLKDLETNQDQVKQDLEKHIQSLRSFIEEFESDYRINMDILNSVSEELMNLLKDLAIDDHVGDQQLLYAGVTERNVGDVLGLIEQRIDDLIQMSKAAANQTLRQEDFIRKSEDRVSSTSSIGSLLPTLVANNSTLFQDLLAIDSSNHHNGDDGANNLRESPINVQDFKSAMQRRRPPKGINSVNALVAINAVRMN